MNQHELSPPAGLPDGVAARLTELDDHTLRETIRYLGDVLEHHHQQNLERALEAIPADELVSVTENEEEGYFQVVRGHRCAQGCPDCPHGPFLYHVRSVPEPDGTESLRWTLIGPMTDAQQ